MMNNKLIYSEPYIQFIEQLLDSMKKGRLLCPKFQRPFVWEIEQQISLLNSIRDGIPIGAIMVWETEKNDINYYKSISGYIFTDREDHPNAQSSKKYILDGLQRLTTLYVTLNQSNDIYESVKNQTKFYYDLKKKKFFSEFDYKKSNNPMLMPLNILLDSMALLKFQRNLFNNLIENDELQEIVSEIDKLSAAFRNYKIPVIPIVTEDISLVTNTFHKINSEGVSVDPQAMIHALTWGSKYDFNDEINKLSMKYLDKQWGEIPIDLIIKSVNLNLGLNIYKTDAVVFGKAVLANKFIIEESIKCIALAVDFIKKYIVIPCYIFIPYSLQLILLAYGFYKIEEHMTREDNRNLLINWFWFTSYSGAFSGMNDNEFKKCANDFLDMLYIGWPIWNNKRVRLPDFIFTTKYNFRSVRTKCSILNLMRLQDRYKLDDISAYDLLSEYGKDSIVNIFSDRQLIINPYEEELLHRTIANKIILNPNKNINIFKKSYFFSNPNSHFVDGFDLSNINLYKFLGVDYDENFFNDSESFFLERLEYLFNQEKIFVESTALKFYECIEF